MTNFLKKFLIENPEENSLNFFYISGDFWPKFFAKISIFSETKLSKNLLDKEAPSSSYNIFQFTKVTLKIAVLYFSVFFMTEKNPKTVKPKQMLKILFKKKIENYIENCAFCQIIKILISEENFDCWRKFRFLTKISIFEENFDFWGKFRFLRKISIFEENFDFWRKFRYLTKISILDENFC